MSRRLMPVVLAAMLPSGGCQSDPFAHRYLKKQPSMAAAAGTYVLDQVYLDALGAGLHESVRKHAPAPKIVLRANGEAELSDFPDIKETRDSRYQWNGFTKKKIRWSILPVGAVSSGSESTTVYGISFEPAEAGGSLNFATFTGREKPDGLVFGFSDPDMGQILGFAKR